MNYLIVQLCGNEALFARFQHKRGGLVFVGASREALTEEGSLTALLAAAAAGAREEERIALALPPAHLFLREMELPIDDRRKLREVLPLELKGETALDSDELVFDALPLGGGKDSRNLGETAGVGGKDLPDGRGAAGAGNRHGIPVSLARPPSGRCKARSHRNH